MVIARPLRRTVETKLLEAAMKNRNGRAAFGALFAAVAALTVTACADTGSAYYGYNSGYYGSRDFCNGPYRLQPEYCRYPEYGGSVYFGGTWHDGRGSRGRR
jgi:hypothetical protein